MIRLFLVSSVRFYREGLAELLRQYVQLQVLGTSPNAHDACDKLRTVVPDIALIDHNLNGSMTLARELVGRCKVVVLGISGSPDDVVGWAEAGISGYVDANSSATELVTVIESAARGEFMCPPAVVARIVQHVGALAAPGTRGESPVRELTAREREILKMIARGLSNKAISQHLGVSLATTKNHVHNLLQKLHVTRRGEAAALVRHLERA